MKTDDFKNFLHEYNVMHFVQRFRFTCALFKLSNSYNGLKYVEGKRLPSMQFYCTCLGNLGAGLELGFLGMGWGSNTMSRRSLPLAVETFRAHAAEDVLKSALSELGWKNVRISKA